MKNTIVSMGLKQGPCEWYYHSGLVIGTGQYNAALRSGEWIWYHSNKVVEKREWYNSTTGELDSVYKYSGKDLYERELFMPGSKRHLYSYSEGKLYRYRFFKANVQDSVEINWYSNGNRLSQAFYSNGRKNGLYTSWHENGRLKERGMMENDNPSGVWERYWSDGRKLKSNEYFPEWGVLEQQVQELLAAPPPQMLDYGYALQMPEPERGWASITPAHEDGMGFMKKYKTVRLQIILRSSGNADIKLVTPMKKKHRIKLKAFLDKEYKNWRPMKMSGIACFCILQLELQWKKAG